MKDAAPSDVNVAACVLTAQRRDKGWWSLGRRWLIASNTLRLDSAIIIGTAKTWYILFKCTILGSEETNKINKLSLTTNNNDSFKGNTYFSSKFFFRDAVNGFEEESHMFTALSFNRPGTFHKTNRETTLRADLPTYGRLARLFKPCRIDWWNK